MIKKILLLFTIISMPMTTLLWAQDLPLQECSDRYAALIFDEKSGEVIFEKRSDQKIYPASLTKLMTLYLTFDALKHKKLEMNQMLVASDRVADIAAVNKNNSLKLKIGDQISVRKAIEASIVKSFNETTIMLAEEVGQAEWQFVTLMNQKAQELGMYNTNFRNASGLFDPGQYTTTYDLGRLAIALKKDFPEYYHLFSLKEFTLNGTKYASHNNVLLGYKGAEGMKTGYTKISGFNLIAIAKRKDTRIISILTACSSYQKRDIFTKELLDMGFRKIALNNSIKEIIDKNPVNNFYSQKLANLDLESDHKD